MRIRTALLILLLAFAAVAAEPPSSRPVRARELQGLWELVTLTKAAEVEQDNSLFAPYQLFYFDAGGRMKHMTSARPFTSNQIAMFGAAPLVTQYTVDRRGTLLLANPGFETKRSYVCSLVLKDAEGASPKLPRTGDVMLAGVDGQGKLLWFKLLRRVRQ